MLYKLIGDRECYDGSIEYGMLLGTYETYDEAYDAKKNFNKLSEVNNYSNLEIVEPEGE